MAIDSVTVGSNERQINVLGDPSTAANKASVLTIADALSLSGKFGLIVGAVKQLLNAGGTYDRAVATPGITGVQAVCIEGLKVTYSVASIGITPAATPTDIWTIYGSGTKTIRINRIEIYALGSSAGSMDIQLIRRSTADSGGTSAAQTPVTHDTNNAAATATVALYSANPTLGTTVGNLRAGKLNFGLAGATGNLIWDFGVRNSQGIVLRGTGQGLVINGAGGTVPAGGALVIAAEFCEDAS